MPNVLIVDDEKSIRRTLGEFLREAGYSVAEAEDAELALRQLSQTAFDVVVSDIILPRVTGVQLLQRLHAVSPHVQVVMMTGEPTVETATESLRAGALDYLSKPITKAAILRVVANAVRIKSLEDTRRRLEAENQTHRENLERLVRERTAQLSASESKARQLSRFNQCILDALTANICVLGESGEILAVNAPWRAFAAANPPLPLNADVGANYLTVCETATGEHVALARQVAQGLRAVIAGQLPEYAVEYACHAHDTQRWFLLRATRFADPETVRVVVAHLDITTRRLAEQQIADALNFNRTIIESSPAGIVTYHARGQAVSANLAAAQIFACTREQILAQNFRQSDAWQSAGLLAAAEQTLATNTQQQLEVAFEPAPGSRLWLVCRLVPFQFAHQPHLLFLAMDVTEQRLTQAKLLRAQRMESIGSLASGIAHDLNNILAPIIMCAPLLQLDDPPIDRRQMAQTIESSARRAAGVVNQLLGFARGKEGLKQPTQLRHLVRDMARIVRETFPRNIQVEETCKPNLWPVLADATQLHQVLLNLCVNARDAMPAGGRLTLRAENVTLDEHFTAMQKDAHAGPFVRLQITDTGTGIPADVQAHIFEAFFTTKGETSGTGLGLATVKGIVKGHQGFITFSTYPGRGTTFEVHLPAAPEAPDQAEHTPSQCPLPRGQGQLVLVVDDEPAICETTRRTLERHGYRALEAHDGIEALAVFSNHPGEIRVVVTDCMMPLMDGVTLCRTLRLLSPTTALVVSSGGLFGQSGSEALQAFQELGIRHVLHKPHSAEVLLHALTDALRPELDPETTG